MGETETVEEAEMGQISFHSAEISSSEVSVLGKRSLLYKMLWA